MNVGVRLCIVSGADRQQTINVLTETLFYNFCHQNGRNVLFCLKGKTKDILFENNVENLFLAFRFFQNNFFAIFSFRQKGKSFFLETKCLQIIFHSFLKFREKLQPPTFMPMVTKQT